MKKMVFGLGLVLSTTLILTGCAGSSIDWSEQGKIRGISKTPTQKAAVPAAAELIQRMRKLCQENGGTFRLLLGQEHHIDIPFDDLWDLIVKIGERHVVTIGSTCVDSQGNPVLRPNN